MLSNNDWDKLSKAFRAMQEEVVEVSMGGTSITVRTARAGRGWSVAMIIGVELRRGGMVVERQWVESIESARDRVGRWSV